VSPPPAAPRRSLLVPEVEQISTMDCGPAALQALLAGFGIGATYTELREACQVDLHGSSIDRLESAAAAWGLAVEQVLLPADFLTLPAARCLPAILVILQPGGVTHFVVVWRRHGRWLQVMDPAAGRRWVSAPALLALTYIHSLRVPAAAWRAWAGSDDFLAPLAGQLAALGLTARQRRRLLAPAIADPGWLGLAALDASTRWTSSLLRTARLRRGAQAHELLSAACAACLAGHGDPTAGAAVPPGSWSVLSAASQGSGGGGEEILIFRGAVLVRALGRRPAPLAGELPGLPRSVEAAAQVGSAAGAALTAAGAPALDACARPSAFPAAALAPAPTFHIPPDPPPPPAPFARPASGRRRVLGRHLLAGGLFAPATLALLIAATVLAAGLETLLLRGLLDLGGELRLPVQRAAGAALLLAFALALVLLELPAALGTLRLGRHLEIRLRAAWLARLPRLGDRFFRSRLPSDLAERAHAAHRLRGAPELAGRMLRAACGLLLATAGIVWLDPPSLPLALAVGTTALALPLLALPPLHRLDRRLRGFAGALAGVSMDALCGLLAIRAHGGEPAIRHRHDPLLAQWATAHRRLRRAEIAADGLVQAVLWALAAALVCGHLRRRGFDAASLLLFFWVHQLCDCGQSLAAAGSQLAALRTVARRLLEPLAEPVEEISTPAPVPAADAGAADSGAALRPPRPGAALSFSGVTVRVAGHLLLDTIDLTLAAGEHIAVVGPSGAGKSSLLGTLLGWYAPTAGRLLADGSPLCGAELERLRRATAWVDPAVRLWNRPLLANLLSGAGRGPLTPAGALRLADLLDLLAVLPEGLQTPLGDNGSRLSDGEGQRLRFARALLRPGVRLALLDEPFRGLGRSQRATLLARAREHWRQATLLCVTHDVSETRRFPRVLVLEQGRLVEDGPPAVLAARPGSTYRALLAAEDRVRGDLASACAWRRLRLEAGRLVETPSAP
jgi:ABC-type bacteriocin/lantibiotic exporter with double-glycine peptidase domain